MKKTEIGKTKLDARALEQKKSFQSAIKIIAIDKAVATFGEKSVKWAINKYPTSVREKRSAFPRKVCRRAANCRAE
jgi:hypothetical protein